MPGGLAGAAEELSRAAAAADVDRGLPSPLPLPPKRDPFQPTLNFTFGSRGSGFSSCLVCLGFGGGGRRDLLLFLLPLLLLCLLLLVFGFHSSSWSFGRSRR